MTRYQEVILTISHHPTCANARLFNNCQQVSTYAQASTTSVGR